MEIKIKIVQGSYALRAYDANNNQIYYTSSRIGGIKYSNGELIASVPDKTTKVEIKNLETFETKIINTEKKELK